MKDLSNELFTVLYDTLNAYDSNIELSSDEDYIPVHLPFVAMTYYPLEARHLSSSDKEQFSGLRVTINIYTNGNLKQSKAKEILHVIDDKFYELNIVRMSAQPTPNINEGIYRYTSIYEAETDGATLYRR